MRRLLIGCCLLVLIAGCGSDDPGSGASSDGHAHGGPVAFGQPAPAEDSKRTIEVSTSDDPLSFEPNEVFIEEGETVTFEIRNEGAMEHEFVLVENPTEEAMQGEHMHGEGTGEIPPGSAGLLTWEFTNAGEFYFECHVNAHHLAGMRGTIVVE